MPEPARPGCNLEELTDGVQGLLDVFSDRGFMLRGSVADVTPSRSPGSIEYHGAGCSGGSFRVRLDAPANLWGGGPCLCPHYANVPPLNNGV